MLICSSKEEDEEEELRRLVGAEAVARLARPLVATDDLDGLVELPEDTLDGRDVALEVALELEDDRESEDADLEGAPAPIMQLHGTGKGEKTFFLRLENTLMAKYISKLN